MSTAFQSSPCPPRQPLSPPFSKLEQIWDTPSCQAFHVPDLSLRSSHDRSEISPPTPPPQTTFLIHGRNSTQLESDRWSSTQVVQIFAAVVIHLDHTLICERTFLLSTKYTSMDTTSLLFENSLPSLFFFFFLSAGPLFLLKDSYHAFPSKDFFSPWCHPTKAFRSPFPSFGDTFCPPSPPFFCQTLWLNPHTHVIHVNHVLVWSISPFLYPLPSRRLRLFDPPTNLHRSFDWTDTDSACFRSLL